jgi:hypothetical protein
MTMSQEFFLKNVIFVGENDDFYKKLDLPLLLWTEL